MKRNVTLTFLLITLFASFGLQAQTTYYVSAANGNDANAGTSGTAAFKTLQKAIDKQFILGSTYSYTFNPLTGNGPQTVHGFGFFSGLFVKLNRFIEAA